MQIIHKAASARAGLIGNPSDGYGGKTIAFTMQNYRAEVSLQEAPVLEIVAGPDDLDRYESVKSLHSKVSQHGYYGGTRLIKATIKQFVDYCTKFNHLLHDRNFAIRYQSNIPQQVGMAGSSAIIIATLRALMDFYDISIDTRIQPSIALNVERSELGIEGGLQDRVAQIYEGLVAMDFSKMSNESGFEFGVYEAIDPALLPAIYVAYKASSSEPTEIFHNDLRVRYDAGDSSVVNAMSRFAELTVAAKTAILNQDYQSLHDAINHRPALKLTKTFNANSNHCTLNRFELFYLRNRCIHSTFHDAFGQ